MPDDKKLELDEAERKARNDLSRAERAERLLNDDLLVAAFGKVEDSLVDIWKKSRVGDEAQRDDAWRSLRLLEGLKHAIGEHVRTGEFARAELARIEQERQWLKPFTGRSSYRF